MMKRAMGMQLKLTGNDEPPFYAQLECGHTAALKVPFTVGERLPCPVCGTNRKRCGS